MSAPKAWTVMVWIAGDNDLESFGAADLAEMKRVGSTADIDVVAQFDRMADARTRRYHLRPETSLDADLVGELGETNTGDPQVAIDFFSWAIATYPARQYLAVIWNHGSGIDETDVYRAAARRGLRVERTRRPSASVIPVARVRRGVVAQHHHAVFSSTVDKAMRSRAIAYDDTARDFLDNAELKRVLAATRKQTGSRIDIIGFDACLMNMIEVAYQNRASARYMVGSTEVEPGAGWPYDRILAALAAMPAMTPAALATAIVREYVASYPRSSVTQSALDLKRARAVATAVDALAGALIPALKDPATYAAITKSLLAAQRYEIRDFLDLVDLCEQLARRVGDGKIVAAAGAVVEAVAGEAGLVVAEAHKGAQVAGSHGVAIYFPRGDASVPYATLDFAKATRWDTFITRYVKG